MISPIEETWLDFSEESPMLTFVSPNDICPITEPLFDNYNHHQQQQPQHQTYQHFHHQETVRDFTNHQVLGPPPILVPNEELKFFSIQQQLDYHKALSQQRQEQLKARLDSEPPKLPSKIMRKATGKKMTGRERQLELEKTELQLLQQRDHYVDLISKLESKCNKLREILGNIVTHSPEYNNQMISCLEADGLLIDSHIN